MFFFDENHHENNSGRLTFVSAKTCAIMLPYPKEGNPTFEKIMTVPNMQPLPH
jgi:hypothetical protein